MSGRSGQTIDGCFSCIEIPLRYRDTFNKYRDTSNKYWDTRHRNT